MKKMIMLGIVLAAVSLPVFAQGLYIDAGLGFGKAWTKVEGNKLDDIPDIHQFTMDLSAKAGWGPFGDLPLYAVLELAGTVQMLWRLDDSYFYNSYIVGPGVLFYPIPLVQLGLTAGYSWTRNNTEVANYDMYNSAAGFAWNTTAAVDLGGKNHAFLAGIKFSMGIYPDETTSMLGVFIKYAFRKKAPPLFK
ncbi:MAG: hypothetical protein LBG84_03135 [Treponema sp.]|jgi:hypothetical protein|nr:hypothetical protein [Treponema sp.]